MNKIIVTIIALLSFTFSYSQVGIGTIVPNQSSALDITDSTRGILIPRMSMVKRNAIVNPAQGLMVYQTDSTKGFWYFEGTGWRNINASSNYGGKYTVVLSDTITNAQAIVKLATEVGPNTQELRITGCLYLTVIDLSMFTHLTNLTITDNPVLQVVNLGNLKTCAGYFSLNNCTVLSNLNVSSLEKIVYAGSTGIVALYINDVGLTTLNFPKLKRVLGTIAITKTRVLTSATFPVLSGDLDGFFARSNSALQTVSFPALQAVSIMQITNNNALTTLSFPSLTRFTLPDPYYQSHVQQAPNLTSLVFGNLTQFSNWGFETLNTKLPSSVVNDLLHKFVSISPPITGKAFDFRQLTASPPTGQGLLDKSQLIAQGNTVSTN